MRRFSLNLMLLCCVTLLGCDQWQSNSDNDLVKELPDLPDMATPSLATAEPGSSDSLTAFSQLKIGQQFTFEKSITHTLTQAIKQPENKSKVQIDLVFTLWLEEIQDDQTRFGLRFQQVKYTQDIAGIKVEYDSQTPPRTIPAAVQYMHELSQLKLSLWRDAQGTISKLTGLPATESVIQTASHKETTKRESISDLLDPAFAVLADANRNRSLLTGQSWILQQQFPGAVSIREKLNCFCKTNDGKSAEVEVAGTILPDQNPDRADSKARSLVKVSSGHTIGKIKYDLTTGMPLESSWQRYISMQVQLENGEQFEQRKDTRSVLKLRLPARAIASEMPPISNLK